MRTVALAFSAMVAGMAPAGCNFKPAQERVDVSILSQLIKNLPYEMQHRVWGLLQRGENPCPVLKEGEFEPLSPMQTFIPAWAQEKIYMNELLMQAGKTTEYNCMAAVDYVISDSRTGYVMDGWDFSQRVRMAGYANVFDATLFEVDDMGLARKVLIDLNQLGLQPGDVLIFAREVFNEAAAADPAVADPNAIAHAAVYLGQEGGTHYMFQKRNSFCGPEFGFAAVSVSGYIEKRISFPVDGQDDGSFSRLVVYHRSEIPSGLVR